MAIFRRAALQLLCVATSTDLCFSNPIRQFYFIACLGFLIPAGDRGSAPSVSCWRETILSTLEKSTEHTRAKVAGFAKCRERFEFLIVAVITQHIIGFVKLLSSELTLAVISSTYRSKLIEQNCRQQIKNWRYVLCFKQGCCGHCGNRQRHSR